MLPLEYRRKRVALLLFFLVCVLIDKNRHTLPPAEGRAKLQEEKMKEIEKNYNPERLKTDFMRSGRRRNTSMQK